MPILFDYDQFPDEYYEQDYADWDQDLFDEWVEDNHH